MKKINNLCIFTFIIVSNPFTTLEEDSKRKDLTYNTLYMDLNGNILEYHNGLEDFKSVTVNTVLGLEFNLF